MLGFITIWYLPNIYFSLGPLVYISPRQAFRTPGFDWRCLPRSSHLPLSVCFPVSELFCSCFVSLCLCGFTPLKKKSIYCDFVGTSEQRKGKCLCSIYHAEAHGRPHHVEGRRLSGYPPAIPRRRWPSRAPFRPERTCACYGCELSSVCCLTKRLAVSKCSTSLLKRVSLEEKCLEGHKVITFKQWNGWRDIDGDRKLTVSCIYLFCASLGSKLHIYDQNNLKGQFNVMVFFQ